MADVKFNDIITMPGATAIISSISYYCDWVEYNVFIMCFNNR